MGMTIDDMYDWLYRLKSEVVIFMPKEWHEPMRCSIQDAITFSRKYQMLKAEYENRLKADMVAILSDLLLETEEMDCETDHDFEGYYCGVVACQKKITEKINALRGEEDGSN